MSVRVLVAIAALCGGCARDTAPRLRVAGGEPDRGARVIQQAGCGACHTIPGIHGARGLVGPPLTSFARRTFIAGELPNTPENLMRWVRDPQAVEPRTAMPTLGLDDGQARDVAAYLYTMR